MLLGEFSSLTEDNSEMPLRTENGDDAPQFRHSATSVATLILASSITLPHDGQKYWFIIEKILSFCPCYPRFYNRGVKKSKFFLYWRKCFLCRELRRKLQKLKSGLKSTCFCCKSLFVNE
jgi:hypothetical protein